MRIWKRASPRRAAIRPPKANNPRVANARRRRLAVTVMVLVHPQISSTDSCLT